MAEPTERWSDDDVLNGEAAEAGADHVLLLGGAGDWRSGGASRYSAEPLVTGDW